MTKRNGAPLRDALQSSTRLYFLAGTGLTLVLILIAGYWGYQRLVVEPQRQGLTQAAAELANAKAAEIDQALQDLNSRIHSFTRQEALARALEQDNAAILKNIKANLGRQLPHARAVRLFRQGAAELDREGDSPIRFAELDMINRAEKRRPVLPEANQVNGQWRLTIVEPVPFATTEEKDRPVAGVLLANVALTEWLADLGKTVPGQLEILQQYPGQQPVPVARYGDPARGEPAEAKVPDSYLLVRLTPSAAAAATNGMNPVLYFALAAALALGVLAVVGLTARRLASAKPAAERESEASLLDVEVSREDRELLGMAERGATDAAAAENEVPPGEQANDDLPEEIFRSYDIRGLVESQLTPANVVLIGQAIGSEALAKGETTLVVARDGRSHSPDVAEQLIEGILATGCNVLNIGMVPTPVMYFACAELEDSNSGVMVTASHNPPDYNGFKIVIAGNTLKDEEIRQLRGRILQRDFQRGGGREDHGDFAGRYIERIFSDIALAGEFSVVIDAGNGVAGEIAPQLFEELGCAVTPLFCEVDGRFPNHPPDPSVPANLEALTAKVKEVGADLGIALDGDGDRVGVITANGVFVAADRLLMVLAKDIVSRNPGTDVVFDVKCSRELNKVISSYGGRPILWKAGHSQMKAKMKATGALLGGELSGHIFIGERWYGFDDGLYAAARILEIMSLREEGLDSILENFPALPATPEIKLSVPEPEKFELVERLLREGQFGDGRVTTVDGLRVDYADGWGLVRASNTSAALTLRFEGTDQAALERIMGVFRKELARISPDLDLNFPPG